MNNFSNSQIQAQALRLTQKFGFFEQKALQRVRGKNIQFQRYAIKGCYLTRNMILRKLRNKTFMLISAAYWLNLESFG